MTLTRGLATPTFETFCMGATFLIFGNIGVEAMLMFNVRFSHSVRSAVEQTVSDSSEFSIPSFTTVDS